MADRIVISGIRRFDGEYDFDIIDEPLTTLEWRWIKKISGYLPLTVSGGWDGQDPDLFLAFAVIAMRRAGKIDKADALSAAERMEDGATITLVADEEVDQQNPPADAPPMTSEQNGTSGERSSLTSDRPGQTHTPTGSRDSERYATSDLPTLVI